MEEVNVNDEPKESGELFNENEREEDYSNDDDIGDSASVTASSIVDAAISDDINLVLSANDGDVETVTAMEEHLLFSVPPELRKDLKAAGKL